MRRNSHLEEILESLPPLQRRILLLKVKGRSDAQIVSELRQLGYPDICLETVRAEIDHLLFQLLSEVSAVASVVEGLHCDVPVAPAGIEIGTYTQPASITSGDFYAFLGLDDDRIGVAIGDGMGHGLGATLLSALVHAHLQTYASRCPTPAATLQSINDTMRQHGTPSQFVTLLYGVLDVTRSTFCVSHASHPYLFHYQASTRDIFQPITLGSSPVPSFDAVNYLDQQLSLCPGDVVVACTDGIIESLNRNENLFGDTQIEPTIKGNARLPADQLGKEIYEAAVQFSGASLLDDATVVVFRRTN